MNERRIATVLRVRSLQERIARSDVARQRVALEHAQGAERAAWEQLDRHSREAPATAGGFLAHRSMLDGGVAEAHQARYHVAEADRRVDHSIAAWQVEAQRLDGIERLAERVRAEASADLARRTANEIDDLVVMRHRGEA